ncbi:MAG: thioredoxin family protein [Acidobacteriota bacterium]
MRPGKLLVFRPATAVCAAGLLFVLGAVPPAAGQRTPDPLFRDFEPVGAFALSIDGEAAPEAEIYQSERGRAMLILGSELDSPLLVNLRSRRVEQVSFMSLAKRQDGTIDVLADAELQPVGGLEVQDDGVRFSAGGREVVLASRESLTGPQSAQALTEYDPSYARGAEQYEPNGSLVRELEETSKPVRVQVFFNSKCSACKQMVPRIIKLDRVLGESAVEFDYYGAPDDYNDPELESKGVTGVPTGIVYVGGEEVGRISGGEWRVPELAIKNVLNGAS